MSVEPVALWRNTSRAGLDGTLTSLATAGASTSCGIYKKRSPVLKDCPSSVRRARPICSPQRLVRAALWSLSARPPFLTCRLLHPGQTLATSSRGTSSSRRRCTRCSSREGSCTRTTSCTSCGWRWGAARAGAEAGCGTREACSRWLSWSSCCIASVSSATYRHERCATEDHPSLHLL